MSQEDVRKQQRQGGQKSGVKQVLDGVVERLREGLEEILDGLRAKPQPVPIPIPVNRPRRR